MYGPQPVDTRGARTLMACKINYKRCKDLKFWNKHRTYSLLALFLSSTSWKFF